MDLPLAFPGLPPAVTATCRAAHREDRGRRRVLWWTRRCGGWARVHRLRREVSLMSQHVGWNVSFGLGVGESPVISR